jgi:hypothetical protein
MSKTPAIATLAVILACLTPVLRAADQTPQEATALLVGGKWDFDGDGVMRHFLPDGNFTSSSGTKGTWSITGNELVMVFPAKDECRFPLPIDLDGTRGVHTKPAGKGGLNEGKPVTLIRERTPLDGTIIDANAASVTVSGAGKTGDIDLEQTYKITASTSITVDGEDVSAGALKAGMRANVKLFGDGNVVQWIHARDPRKH